MPVWIIELFGNRQLNHAFWTLNALVAPFWLMMIFLPHNKRIRMICHPFFAPVVMSLVYLYTIYLVVTITGIPQLEGFEARSFRRFIDHPIVFLVLWAHYITLDLFLGMTLYRHASRRRLRIPGELILCWLFGPAGLLAYALRLAFHQGIGRTILRWVR